MHHTHPQDVAGPSTEDVLRAENAQLLTQLRDLERAARAWSVIDQAVGVVMAQNRCGPGEAYEILRTASRNRNRRMTEIATTVIGRIAGSVPHPPTFTPAPADDPARARDTGPAAG